MIMIVKAAATATYNFFKEFVQDWAVAKYPVLMVMALDYLDVLNKISKLHIDVQFSYYALAIILLDTASGATYALGKGTFSFKVLGEGFLKKIWKWGRAILLVALLKNYTVGGTINEVYSKVDLIIFTFIMSVEGDSASKYILGFKISEKLNIGIKAIKNFKKPN